ncbi:MAG: hypothetical protein RR416_04270, partial [Clostridia bacterium]
FDKLYTILMNNGDIARFILNKCIKVLINIHIIFYIITQNLSFNFKNLLKIDIFQLALDCHFLLKEFIEFCTKFVFL